MYQILVKTKILYVSLKFLDEDVWYHSHLRGCSFSKLSIYTGVSSSRDSNGDITSRFNIAGGAGVVLGGGSRARRS